MAWHRIDPRYLRQSDPEGLTLAYVSHGERDTGHLLLHLDCEREVARFELTYDRFLGPGELYAVWDRSTGLSVGSIDTHGHRDAPGLYPGVTPLVRWHRRASAEDLAAFLGYVKRHIDALDPPHGRAVVAALRACIRRARESETRSASLRTETRLERAVAKTRVRLT